MPAMAMGLAGSVGSVIALGQTQNDHGSSESAGHSGQTARLNSRYNSLTVSIALDLFDLRK